MFVFVQLLKRVLRCFCLCRSSEESVEMFVVCADLLKRVLRCSCVCVDLLKRVLSVCVFVQIF